MERVQTITMLVAHVLSVLYITFERRRLITQMLNATQNDTRTDVHIQSTLHSYDTIK